jgi:hypothetical protein
MAGCRSSCKATSDRLGEHHRTLYGNGRPGLAQRVQKLEDGRVRDGREAQDEKDADAMNDEARWPLWKKVVVGITIYVGTNVVTGLTVYFLWLYHEHPLP